ncbi:ribosomal protein S18-alanine N-acetyltransferase [Nocardiopsis ansamitocini]|uniref:Ribosomal-protein-alanine acetyltransferase n=1 Tax=Nocardiopsis ansamitocini TaxID=1670832 RepID=A0A9W6UK36_9ACTN|nr:ribosomal protein S18-alanine N-acetyltransferase [Nocardiopsis ansamitocini]GLU49337.1 ribosomal-protein-alanine acetyltransferase [Nocardiopsis ansamitocini]
MTHPLRLMNPADVVAVMELERTLFPADAWSEAMMREELAEPSRYYLVAENPGGEGILGYAGLRCVAPEGDVQTIAVAAGNEGKGIGSALLAALLEEAARRGVLEMFLEVRSDNPRAQDLYRRFGFAEIGVRRGYYVGADAIVMRRSATTVETTGRGIR